MGTTQGFCVLFWTNRGHLPPISQTIQIRWTRHAGHCWRSKAELISNGILWTPTHEHTGQPTKTYIHQLWGDTGYRLGDLPRAMTDRDGWRGKRWGNLCCWHVLTIMCTYLRILVQHYLSGSVWSAQNTQKNKNKNIKKKKNTHTNSEKPLNRIFKFSDQFPLKHLHNTFF